MKKRPLSLSKVTSPYLVASFLLLFLGLFSSLKLAGQAGNYDVPVSLFESHNGNLRVDDGGISLFDPAVTSGTFNVTLDACASGAPTVVAAYLTWYTRTRVAGVEATNETLPNFDHTADVRINSAGAFTSVTASDDIAGTDTDGDEVYLARFDSRFANNDRLFWRAYRVIDLVQNAPAVASALTAGINTIDVQGLDLPSTPAGINSNNHFGVALTIVYECADFDDTEVYYNAGLDFTYCAQTEANPANDDTYVGSFTNVICQTLTASTAARTVGIEGIIGGQAKVAAAFRGHVLSAWSGTGAAPTTVASAPTNQAPAGAYTFDGPHATLVSNLGHEWDEINGLLTVPIGDTYICVQMESANGPNFPTDSDETCISGDLLSPTFAVPAAVTANPGQEPCAGDFVLDFTDPNWNGGTGLIEGSTPATGLPIAATQTITNYAGTGLDVTLEFDGKVRTMADGGSSFDGPNVYTDNDWLAPYDDALRWVTDNTPGSPQENTVTITFSGPIDLFALNNQKLSQRPITPIINVYEQSRFELYDGPNGTGNRVAIPSGTGAVSTIDPVPAGGSYTTDLPDLDYTGDVLTLTANSETPQGAQITFGGVEIRSIVWTISYVDAAGVITDDWRSSQSIDNICFSAPVSACSIDADANLANVACAGNDAVTFDLAPTGTDVGATYNVSVSGGNATSISPASGTYGTTTTFTLNDGVVSGGDITVTLTDVDDSGCTLDVVVTDPGTCFSCPDLSVLTAPSSVCVNSVPSTLSVNVANLGTYTDDITFVLFDSQQTGTGMYDNTPLATLGTVANAAISGGLATLATVANFPTTPGIFYIYAILDPAPSAPNDSCRSAAEATVEVLSVDCGTYPWGGN